jgi:TonB-dependent SusC/RagA subfamily outer membrane receptor
MRAAEDVLARPVTMVLRDVSLQQAVDTLARVSDALLQYRVGIFSGETKRISMHVTNTPLGVAFDRVLEGTGLRVVPASQGHLMLVATTSVPSDSTPATGTVAGRVVDSATGRGLAGVTIKIAGLPASMVTSDSGRFTLRDVPVGPRMLSARVFGYRPTEQLVTVASDGRVTVRLVMAAAPNILSGVVTTASGQQRRVEVGNDITTINVDSVLQQAPITSVTDLLENRVPGLTVQRSSGTPGAPARIRIRGASSMLAANNPIVVVDGTRMYYPDDFSSGAKSQYATIQGGKVARPSPLDQIDPNSIDKIEVLKGPSASAIYGADAANGVIVVTTKRGKAGTTHWSLTGNAGVGYIPGSYPTFNFPFGHALTTGGSIVPCIGGIVQYTVGNYTACDVDSVVSFQALNDKRYTPLTRGNNSALSGTVSGGASVFTYSFTGSVAGNDGYLKMPDVVVSQYQRFSGMTAPEWMRHPNRYTSWNESGSVNAILKPGASLTMSQQLNNSAQRSSSMSLNAVSQLIGQYVDTTTFTNTPLFRGFAERMDNNTITSMTTATLVWQPTPALPVVTVQAGINHNTNEDKTFIPSGLPTVLLGQTGATDTAGWFSTGRMSALLKTFNANTTIPMPLPYGARINFATGLNVVSTRSGILQGQVHSLPRNVMSPTSLTAGTQSSASQATYGYFVEPQLRLTPKLFVNLGLRLDGGSASGSNSGLTAFPKITQSFVLIDNQDVGANAPGWRQFVSLLRVRTGVGIAGVQPSPEQHLRLFKQQTLSVDGGTSTRTAILPTNFGNSLLRPERSREFEGGFDIDFLHSRVVVSTTGYRKTRLDAIEQVSPGTSVGDFSSQYVNLGTIRSTGGDVQVSAQLIESPLLTWDVSTAVSADRNRVVSLEENTTAFTSGASGSRIVVGYPLTGVWAAPLVGFSDANGNGLIDINEVLRGDSLLYLGSQSPSLTSTFHTQVGLFNRRLILSADAAYTGGVLQENQLALTALQSTASLPGATLTQQAIAMFAASGGTLIAPGNIEEYQSVNTFRLSDVSIGYTLPDAVARRFHGRSLSAAIQGSNLLLKTNYRGKDPNVNSLMSGEGISDSGQIPQPRTWSFKLTLTN